MRLTRVTVSFVKMFILVFSMTTSAMAEDVKIIGSIQHSIAPLPSPTSLKNNQTSPVKEIHLLKIELSNEGYQLLTRRMKEILATPASSPLTSQQPKLPEKVQLRMNNVPVLDQGPHGSCVTFAVTAALDASLGKGDYISQLCLLQLGNYLERHWYISSGWNGTTTSSVIDIIQQFGIVSIQKQKSIGCGGITEYPTYSAYTPNTFIDPEHYYPMSELINGKIANWSNIYWRISSTWTLSEIKKALASGDRAVISIMLPRPNLGTVNAVGKFKAKNDTWILTPEIIKNANRVNVGHTLVVTGYNDKAIAVDKEGNKHIGLLELRNSWGSKCADRGNFYMSYDYFKLLTFDVRRLSPN